MKSRYNPLLLAVIAMGLVAALWLNWTRHEIEQRNNTVEMAMEYENLRRLAALEGLPEEAVLAQFKEAGITSLMVFDTNLLRLQDKGLVQIATGRELAQAAALGNKLGAFAPAVDQGLVEENAVFVAQGSDLLSYNDTVQDLLVRYGAGRVQVVVPAGSADLSKSADSKDSKDSKMQPGLVKVLGSTKLVPEGRYDEPFGPLQHPLGLPRRDMERVQEAGFKLIVRPQNYAQPTAEQIDSIFTRIKDSGVAVHAYMPCGRETVGYPNQLQHLAQRMEENNWQLIMLEHYSQLRFVDIAGLIPLAEMLDYKAARSYVIDGIEQKRLPIPTALRRWALTDEERNVRVNYIRPFYMPQEGKGLLEQNLQYVRDIKANVAARGYDFGQAGVFSASAAEYAPYFPNKLYFVPIMAAIIAGCLLYLALLLPMSGRLQVGALLVLTVAASALVIFGRGLLTRQLLALAGVVIFPVLSLSYITYLWRKQAGALQAKQEEIGFMSLLAKCLWQLAVAILISLMGGLFLSALLTDARFLLEIDIYRGVKLTFVLPVLLMALLLGKELNLLPQLNMVLTKAKELLQAKLTMQHLIILAVFLFVAYMFVGRSGHGGGVPVPALEIKLRAFLEDVMYARPREKEFLIGHPCFFLAALAAYKGAPALWQLVLGCGAIIGQGSLAQTFCHMRTPVVMSVVRAADGYVVGIIFGLVALAGAWLLLPWLRRLIRS